MERVTGIEPALSAWEAEVLPLNYTRACRTVTPVRRLSSIDEEGKAPVFGHKLIRHDDCSVHGPILPEHVLLASFRQRRIGVGYDPDEVDDFLDLVASSLAGYTHPVTALDIRQHEFGNAKRRGYCPEEVDNFLECIAQTLEGRAGGYVVGWNPEPPALGDSQELPPQV